jgi:hypothetical protein
MIIVVNWNVYKRILQVLRKRNKTIIPIIRYKPIIEFKENDIVRIRPSHSIGMLRTRSLLAKVIRIEEFDAKKDDLPYDDLRYIYDNFLNRIHDVPRIFIVYVEIFPLSS